MARNVVAVAHQYLGVPYVWGGNSSAGLDCSGFLQNVFKDMGVNLPRTTYQQFKTGQAVGLRNLKPGDAVFTEPTKAGPGHVGLYIGGGRVQESPHTGTRNQIIPLKAFLGDGFVGARRYAGGLSGGSPGQLGGGGTLPANGNQAALLSLMTSVLANNQQHAPVAPQTDPYQVQLGLGGVNG